MSKLIDVAQGTEAWYEARLGVPSASRFGDILAKTRSGYSTSRANYVVELALERVSGQRAENYVSKAMQDGIDYEPVARLEYTLATGNEVKETGFWLTGTGAGASPDGLIGTDGVLEIKNPIPATHLATLHTGKIPRQYIAQVQGQMWATDRKWCDFVSYCAKMPTNAQMIIIRINRDDDYIDELIEEVQDFLEELEEEQSFIKSYKKEVR